MQLLYVNEDNLIELANVRSGATGALVSNATVTAQLYADDGTTEVGGSINMPAVGSDKGLYQGTLPYDTPLEIDSEYFLEIEADGSIRGARRIKCRAVYHREDV